MSISLTSLTNRLLSPPPLAASQLPSLRVVSGNDRSVFRNADKPELFRLRPVSTEPLGSFFIWKNAAGPWFSLARAGGMRRTASPLPEHLRGTQGGGARPSYCLRRFITHQNA